MKRKPLQRCYLYFPLKRSVFNTVEGSSAQVIFRGTVLGFYRAEPFCLEENFGLVFAGAVLRVLLGLSLSVGFMVLATQMVFSAQRKSLHNWQVFKA